MIKQVTCVDIQGNSYQVDADKLRFRPSVYALVIQDDKVLLSPQWDGYDLPGGGVKLGETFEEALAREVQEETGLVVEMGKLITSQTSFFKLPNHEDEFVHSILNYYQAHVIGGTLSDEGFDEHEKKYVQLAEWVDIAKIDTIKFYSSVDIKKFIQSM